MLKVLILGATGMLGHVLLRDLAASEEYDVHATARHIEPLRGALPASLLDRVVSGIDADDRDAVRAVLDTVGPDVVINAIGVIKQDPRVQDTARTIAINALFPHVLAAECRRIGARFVQVSTDCVFSGKEGSYTEETQPDARDFYGLSKQLGEVPAPALVLRTSIIGHELSGHRSLLDWFLSSTGTVRGFTRAIYTGVTTTEFAKLLGTVVLRRPELTGLLHVAAEPISKHDLLSLVAGEYDWKGTIVADATFACDRSMLAGKLYDLTGYQPPDWPTMIREMHQAANLWRRADARLAIA